MNHTLPTAEILRGKNARAWVFLEFEKINGNENENGNENIKTKTKKNPWSR